MSQHRKTHVVVSCVVMTKAKPILLLLVFVFASLGGCFGPLAAATHSMNCCASMPCSPASPSRSCCNPEVPGLVNRLQQTDEVTAPTVYYAILATLPHSSIAPDAVQAEHVQFGFYGYSPPGELYTIHHSLLI